MFHNKLITYSNISVVLMLNVYMLFVVVDVDWYGWLSVIACHNVNTVAAAALVTFLDARRSHSVGLTHSDSVTVKDNDGGVDDDSDSWRMMNVRQNRNDFNIDVMYRYYQISSFISMLTISRRTQEFCWRRVIHCTRYITLRIKTP